jgi:membrane-bound metal-dependent hydrolase YbcI (DUF457 family)
MPFTPYHFGPNLAVGLVFKRWINIPALVLMNVVMDIEPLIVILLNIHNYPEHGLTHTYGGAIALALLASLFLNAIKKPMNDMMGLVGLRQSNTLTSIVIGCLLGAVFHVFLDSFMYHDIKPFFPFDVNPFSNRAEPGDVRFFCVVCYGAAVIIYGGMLAYRTNLKKKNKLL